MEKEFDRAIKNLCHRDWPGIKSQWRVAFQDYSEIGSPPGSSVQDVIEQKASELILTGTTKQVILDFPQIRNVYIREAIYLAHKSGALLRSFDRDLVSNQPTYAEATAYTASLFLARAICIILGVSFTSVKIHNANWIIDALCKDKKIYKVQAIKTGAKQIGHQELWALLKRILRTTKGSPLDPELNAFMSDINDNEFAASRNKFQYHNCVWTYDDLHSPVKEDLWLVPFKESVYSMYSPAEEDVYFPVLFYMILLRAFCKLLGDMGDGIVPIQQEIDIIKRNATTLAGVSASSTWI